MDTNNGLPFLKEKNALDHGEYILLSGDDDMVFGSQGGGISLFIVLDM